MKIGDLVQALQKDYQRLGNWRLVAEARGISKGMAYRIAVQGYIPKSAAIRLKLGLPLPNVMVTPVQGDIPEGSQAFYARKCPCGEWFITSPGRRRRCYRCSPPHSKNGSKQESEA